MKMWWESDQCSCTGVTETAFAKLCSYQWTSNIDGYQKKLVVAAEE